MLKGSLEVIDKVVFMWSEGYFNAPDCPFLRNKCWIFDFFIFVYLLLHIWNFLIKKLILIFVVSFYSPHPLISWEYYWWINQIICAGEKFSIVWRNEHGCRPRVLKELKKLAINFLFFFYLFFNCSFSNL